jgi:hypothetical protein
LRTAAVQGPSQMQGEPKDIACSTADGWMLGRGRVDEQRMLDEQGAFERDEGGDGEVDDDDLGRDEQPMEVPGCHRFRAAAVAGLALGVWANTSRKSFSSRRASSRSAATASSSSARFMSTR